MSRRIALTTPSNPATKRATRLTLAPSSPLPRGAQNATAMRKMPKARKNRLASVCTAPFMLLFPPSAARRLPTTFGGDCARLLGEDHGLHAGNLKPFAAAHVLAG